MIKRQIADYVGGNRVLDAVPLAERVRIAKDLDVIDVLSGDLLQTPDGDVSYVYFPIDAVLSIIAEMRDGSVCEVGTIGNEGAAGLEFAFGATPLRTTICQVEGSVARMTTDRFLAATHARRGFTYLIARVSQAQRFFVEQQCACNAIHSLDKRCARWMMMIYERVKRDEFALTHDFLSVMLGVRRATVSRAAMKLQAAGIISYRYGIVRVLDVDKLASSCCECYDATRNVFDSSLSMHDDALSPTT